MERSAFPPAAGEGVGVHSESFKLETRGEVEAIDITERVAAVVRRSRLSRGIACVFTPSSTSAIVANESRANVDRDLADLLERVAPKGGAYRHEEKWHDGNGHSHVRATLLGPSLSFPVRDGSPALGAWQQLWFLELDNKPRTRTVEVTLVGE